MREKFIKVTIFDRSLFPDAYINVRNIAWVSEGVREGVCVVTCVGVNKSFEVQGSPADIMLRIEQADRKSKRSVR